MSAWSSTQTPSLINTVSASSIAVTSITLNGCPNGPLSGNSFLGAVGTSSQIIGRRILATGKLSARLLGKASRTLFNSNMASTTNTGSTVGQSAIVAAVLTLPPGLSQDMVTAGSKAFLTALATQLQSGSFASAYGVVSAIASDSTTSSIALPKDPAASNMQKPSYLPAQNNTGVVVSQLTSAPAPSSGGGDSFSGNSASVIIGVTVAIGALVLVVVAAAIIYFNRLLQRKKNYASEYLGGSDAAPLPRSVGPPRTKAAFVGAWLNSVSESLNAQQKVHRDIVSSGDTSAESSKETKIHQTTPANTGAEALQQESYQSRNVVGCHRVHLSDSESNGGPPTRQPSTVMLDIVPRTRESSNGIATLTNPAMSDDRGEIEEGLWDKIARQFQGIDDDKECGDEALAAHSNSAIPITSYRSSNSSGGSVCMWVNPAVVQDATQRPAVAAAVSRYDATSLISNAQSCRYETASITTSTSLEGTDRNSNTSNHTMPIIGIVRLEL